jgi:hypothetical protein
MSKSQNQKPKVFHKCYHHRNNILSQLGFANYKEYLKSSVWKQIRGNKPPR